ncbi:hypothetical protein Esti_001931 [Eimeria stiedai]
MQQENTMLTPSYRISGNEGFESSEDKRLRGREKPSSPSMTSMLPSRFDWLKRHRWCWPSTLQTPPTLKEQEEALHESVQSSSKVFSWIASVEREEPREPPSFNSATQEDDAGCVSGKGVQRQLLSAEGFRLFALCYIAYAVLYFTRKPFSVVKEEMRAQVNISTFVLGWIDTAFLACYACGQLLMPLCISKLSSEQLNVVLLSCFFGSFVAAVAFGCSSTASWFLGIWGFNGLMHSPAFPIMIKILSTEVSPQARGLVMGVWTTSQQLGGITATVFCSLVDWGHGWRAVFCSAGIFCLLGGLALLILLPKFAAASMKAELFLVDAETGALTGRRRQPVESTLPVVADCSVSTLGVLAFFDAASPQKAIELNDLSTRHDPQEDEDACDPGDSLVKHPPMSFVRYTLAFWLPFFLCRIANLSVTSAGLSSMIFDLGGVAGAVLGGMVADALLGGKRLSLAGFMCVATGLCLLLVALSCQQLNNLRRSEQALLLERQVAFQNLQRTLQQDWTRLIQDDGGKLISPPSPLQQHQQQQQQLEELASTQAFQGAPTTMKLRPRPRTPEEEHLFERHEKQAKELEPVNRGGADLNSTENLKTAGAPLFDDGPGPSKAQANQLDGFEFKTPRRLWPDGQSLAGKEGEDLSLLNESRETSEGLKTNELAAAQKQKKQAAVASVSPPQKAAAARLVYPEVAQWDEEQEARIAALQKNHAGRQSSLSAQLEVKSNLLKTHASWQLAQLLGSLLLLGLFNAVPDSVLGASAAQDLHELPGAQRSNVAAVAAFINAIGSLGALCQGICTAAVSEYFGWDVLFGLLCVFSVFSAILLLPAALREGVKS